MHFKFTKILTLLFLFLLAPANGCSGISSTAASSVEEYSCTAKTRMSRIPSTPHITLSTSRCEDYVFKKEKLSQAINLFVLEYSESFDIDKDLVWAMLHRLHIEVSAIPRTVDLAYDTHGKLVKNPAVSGLALSPKHIWVEIKTSQIWSTSLAHELVHVIIWTSNFGIHGDPDHEGDQFSGWTPKHTQFIREFNKILLDYEI